MNRAVAVDNSHPNAVGEERTTWLDYAFGTTISEVEVTIRCEGHV